MKAKSRILVVRNDRLGDLVLTTPVFDALKHAMPQSRITALVSPANLELVHDNPFLDSILVDEYDHTPVGLYQLVRDLRQCGFDAALMVVPTLRMALALMLAGIPLRTGPTTHAYCYALLTRPIRQRRSRVEKHEAEYNLDLLSGLGVKAPADPRAWVHPDPEDVKWARQKLMSLGAWSQGRKLVLVHPCSSGSARNWKENQWAALLKYLQDDGRAVCVLTGTQKDRNTIDRFLFHYGLLAKSLAGQTTLARFIAVISLADFLVAPSTGPLHLSAAQGVRTVGVFSPIRVQSPKRWGPWKADNARTFVPDVSCPAVFKCERNQCPHFDCMDRVRPGDVYREISRCL